MSGDRIDSSVYQKLSTPQMAKFVARGCLMFEGITPPELNEQYLDEATGPNVPEVPAGTPLVDAYSAGSALHGLVNTPAVRGILDSLVGPNPLVDHHFVHLTLGREQRESFGIKEAFPSQHWHQDSTIDTRAGFDVQIDLTPSLANVKHALHVYYSGHDWWYLGFATHVVGTQDRKWAEPASGRVGFRYEAKSPEQEALGHKLKQHPWKAADGQTGHFGGHFGAYHPEFLRRNLLPLTIAQANDHFLDDEDRNAANE